MIENSMGLIPVQEKNEIVKSKKRITINIKKSEIINILKTIYKVFKILIILLFVILIIKDFKFISEFITFKAITTVLSRLLAVCSISAVIGGIILFGISMLIELLFTPLKKH